MELEAFIGEWSIEAGFEGAPTGTVEFEWMPGGKFVVQRWEVPVPEAPDGLAAIGFEVGEEVVGRLGVDRLRHVVYL